MFLYKNDENDGNKSNKVFELNISNSFPCTIISINYGIRNLVIRSRHSQSFLIEILIKNMIND